MDFVFPTSCTCTPFGEPDYLSVEPLSGSVGASLMVTKVCPVGSRTEWE